MTNKTRYYAFVYTDYANCGDPAIYVTCADCPDPDGQPSVVWSGTQAPLTMIVAESLKHNRIHKAE